MIRLFIIAVATLLAATGASLAQDSVAGASRVLWDVWEIVLPIFALLASTMGTILIPWIAAKVISVLNINDENKRKELEAEFRNALHQSATNAVKYAVSKLGLPAIGSVDTTSDIVQEAIKYIKQKNPETVRKFGLQPRELAEIVMSKIPDIVGMVGPDTVKFPASVAAKKK